MPGYDQSLEPAAPIAPVTLRHPNTGASVTNVAMLIDSGADLTLVPRAAVGSLGVVGTGERYSLMAFDGATSEAEAVRVDLIFLNRRFRGRFLVLDAEVGVIGRDVLNNVRILLNGPDRRWEEWSPTIGPALS